MKKKKMGFYNLRKKQRYSQEALAKAVGVSQGSIKKYEQGECLPSVSVLVELAYFLEVSLEELVIALGLNPKAETKKERLNK